LVVARRLPSQGQSRFRFLGLKNCMPQGIDVNPDKLIRINISSCLILNDKGVKSIVWVTFCFGDYL